MRSARILVAALALGACTTTAPPPAAVAPPVLSPSAERAHLAECAEGAALVDKGNAILASRGRGDLVDTRKPCDPPPADSGVRYAKPTPPRVSVTCRTYHFKSSGNSTTTCTSS